MSLLTRSFYICLFGLAILWPDRCEAADGNDPTATGPPVTLAANITVRMPDGSPAARATIQFIRMFEFQPAIVIADENGNAQLRDPFLAGVHIAAASEDHRFQGSLSISESDARAEVSRPWTITLQPATPHQVIVTARGAPVEGAKVAIRGGTSIRNGVTQADGGVVLWSPASEAIKTVVAWHPVLGVDGRRFGKNSRTRKSAGSQTQLELHRPKEHLVRLVDTDGNPVAGQAITASVICDKSDSISARMIEETRAVSDTKGEVRFRWFPASGLKSVYIYLLDKEWKKDSADLDSLADGLTTVTIRKKHTVVGRVEMPEGVDAHGLLITGFGFGPDSNGDLPRARTRADGSFDLMVASGHGYVMGVLDSTWTSDIWSGSVIAVEGQPQREIVMQGSKATPIEIRVTRGDPAEGVEQASVHVSRRGRVEFTLESGESKSGRAGIGGWVRTGKDGIGLTSMGPGEIRLRVSSGDWSEEKTIEVTDGKPASVHFHRAWVGERLLKAQPAIDDGQFVPSSTAVALAWTERSTYVDPIHEATINSDGTVQVIFDQDEVAVLLLDRNKHVSGFARAGKGVTEVTLPMLSNASYSGTLVDRFDDSPLADRTVRMVTDSSFMDIVESQQTDSEGHFEFTDLAAGVSLRLTVARENGRLDYVLFGGDRLFEPREVRTGDIARASLMDGNRSVDRKPKETRTIAQRIARAAEDSRVMGMRLLVLMEGGASKSVPHVAGRLSNDDEVSEISRFLVVRVTTKQLQEDDGSFAQLDWPQPGEGELVIAATIDGRKTLSSQRLDCSSIDDAVVRGSEFIRANSPPTRDGRVKLDEAISAASKSGRSVWVIVGGPRCGPCFRLARWIDQHHAVLEKDLVIVKLTAGLDNHSGEIGDQIGGEGHGIPFHALMSPSGELLVDSEGPLGNIGMPGSVEGIRHFESMLKSISKRMTPEDIAALIASLQDDE